jgi:hypothetical protein
MKYWMVSGAKSTVGRFERNGSIWRWLGVRAYSNSASKVLLKL